MPRGRRRSVMPASAYTATALESGMEESIRELVEWKKGRMWHIRDSRGAPETADMPDLLILIPGRVLVIESKSQNRALTPGQSAVADLMSTVTGCTLGVMRPNPLAGELSFDQVLQIISET